MSLDGSPASATAAVEVPDRGVREVKSAARAVDLLELLAERSNRPNRLRDLSDAMGAPRSSVYALLRTLVERGWVRTDATGTLYSIGIQSLLVGTTYLDVDPFLRIVQPQLNELSLKLDETIHYSRLKGPDVVYLATHESSQYVRPFTRIGRRVPAYSTAMGKALLAERIDSLGPEGLSAHLPPTLGPVTPNTLIDYDALVTDLREVRSRGYAIDREESLIGVACFSFALRLTPVPADAISCSVPLERLHEGRESEIIEALRRTRHTIERMAPVTPPSQY
jgi:DNA-binding IclR family transcriptional regulator